MVTAIGIVIIVLMLTLAYSLWRLLLSRAIEKVVHIFRQSNATDPKGAKTLEALDLVPRGALGRMFRLRDYKQTALRIMGQEGVIRMLEGGRLYLSEEALAGSSIKKFAGLE